MNLYYSYLPSEQQSILHYRIIYLYFIVINSDTACLIRKTSLIVWDEAPINHRNLLEALECTLRDIMGIDVPFGGKIILLAGDFRQILPVVKRGSRAQIIQASIKKSPFWHQFKTFTLTENMRIANAGADLRLQQFIDGWLLRVGKGTFAHCNSDIDYVVLQEEMCILIKNHNQLTLKALKANLVN